MIVGIPRERKILERRVALTPDGARELIDRGHKVLIENGAGKGSFFDDSEYKAVGCTIVSSLEALWKQSNLIVKVKEPDPAEYPFFREDLLLFDYLHLASMPELTKAMLRGRITSIAYELVQLETGQLPLLEPMSEVAGKLSVLNGAYFLLAQNLGRGVLLGGTIGVSPEKVVILGAGVAGRAAAEVAAGIGAEVVIFDISHDKLERVKLQFNHNVRALFSGKSAILKELSDASLLVGAVLIPGAATPKVITKEMIKTMPYGAVFVDISIDQGGCSETSIITTLEEPVVEIDGIIHYGVCNMPAQTPRTSTVALVSATLPYIIHLADQGLTALQTSKWLRNALCTHKGLLTNEAVARDTELNYTAIDIALGSMNYMKTNEVAKITS